MSNKANLRSILSEITMEKKVEINGYKTIFLVNFGDAYCVFRFWNIWEEKCWALILKR